LLGAFILFQLAFLILSNLLQLFKYTPSDVPQQPRKLMRVALRDFVEEKDHGWKWAEHVEESFAFWTQLTGQYQNWSLFCPTVARGTSFPCILLVWDDPTAEVLPLPGTMFSYHERNGIHLATPWDPPKREPSFSTTLALGTLAATHPWEALHLHAMRLAQEEAPPPRVKMLISENEPDDIDSFFRTGRCRLRRYESQFYLNLQPREKAPASEKNPKPIMDTPEETAADATYRVRRLVNNYHDMTLAYMKWRFKEWKKENPGAPGPKQVILLERFCRIHDPEIGADGKIIEKRGWDGPMLWPIARWQPEHPNPNPSGWVLEYFDFTDRRFTPIR
jgi:hypothetical protein